MSIRKKVATVVSLAVMISISAGTFFIVQRMSQIEEVTPEEGKAADLTNLPSPDIVDFRMNPLEIDTDDYVSMNAWVDNDENTDYFVLYIDGTERGSTRSSTITRQTRLFGHIHTPTGWEYQENVYKHISQTPVLSGVMTGMLSNEDVLQNFHDDSYEIASITGFVIDNQNQQDNTKRVATFNPRTVGGEQVCGIEYITFDELVHREDGDPTLAAENIILTRKLIEQAENSAGCRSITKIGDVEWNATHLTDLLELLKNIHDDTGNPDQEYAYLDFIEMENYGTGPPIDVGDLLNLKNNYGINEAHMWVMGTKQALGLSGQVDAVIIADVLGAWIREGSASFNRLNYSKEYTPCIYDPENTGYPSCRPYLSTLQQELALVDDILDQGGVRSYGLLEYSFPSNGTYEVKVKAFSDTLGFLSEKSMSINVGDGSSICNIDCVNKECGNGGCDGTCGSCPVDEVCNLDGQCELFSCTRDCTGKDCGSDGCGGSCGTCNTGYSCQSGICQLTVNSSADINGDGNVNMTDYYEFVQDYLLYKDGNVLKERSDLNGDEEMSMADYSIFVEEYLIAKGL